MHCLSIIAILVSGFSEGGSISGWHTLRLRQHGVLSFNEGPVQAHYSIYRTPST